MSFSSPRLAMLLLALLAAPALRIGSTAARYFKNEWVLGWGGARPEATSVWGEYILRVYAGQLCRASLC